MYYIARRDCCNVEICQKTCSSTRSRVQRVSLAPSVKSWRNFNSLPGSVTAVTCNNSLPTNHDVDQLFFPSNSSIKLTCRTFSSPLFSILSVAYMDSPASVDCCSSPLLAGSGVNILQCTNAVMALADARAVSVGCCVIIRPYLCLNESRQVAASSAESAHMMLPIHWTGDSACTGIQQVRKPVTHR